MIKMSGCWVLTCKHSCPKNGSLNTNLIMNRSPRKKYSSETEASRNQVYENSSRKWYMKIKWRPSFSFKSIHRAHNPSGCTKPRLTQKSCQNSTTGYRVNHVVWCDIIRGSHTAKTLTRVAKYIIWRLISAEESGYESLFRMFKVF